MIIEPDRPIATLDFRRARADAVPFEIGRVETTRPPRAGRRPHRHSHYEILWITDGAGTHTIDFREYPVAPGAVFLLPPGPVHSLRVERPLSGFKIFFTAEFLALDTPLRDPPSPLPFFRPGEPDAVLFLTAPEAGRVGRIVEDLEAEFRADEPGRREMLRAHLQVLLLTLGRLALGRGDLPAPPPPLARQFLLLVEEHFRHTTRVGDYARLLAVTPGHLGDAVKAATGKTAGAHLAGRALLEAKRLLTHSDRTSAEIAAELGFADPSYFGRFFRRHEGRSPGAFRAASRGKYQDTR